MVKSLRKKSTIYVSRAFIGFLSIASPSRLCLEPIGDLASLPRLQAECDTVTAFAKTFGLGNLVNARHPKKPVISTTEKLSSMFFPIKISCRNNKVVFHFKVLPTNLQVEIKLKSTAMTLSKASCFQRWNYVPHPDVFWA